MLLSNLATSVAALDERTFVTLFPRPALVFALRPGRICDSSEETPQDEALWARTGSHALPGTPGAGLPEEPPSDGVPVVAFLRKSTRNPFSGLIMVGRRPNADVVMVSSAISKVHLLFSERPAGEGWTVLDQNSTNGTTLNGVPLEHGRLFRVRDGDRLVLAQSAVATFVEPASLFQMVALQARARTLAGGDWLEIGDGQGPPSIGRAEPGISRR